MRAIERALLIVNPRAHAVTPGLASRVAGRLAAAFDLDVAHTSGRLHATGLAREAARGGADAVVTFSGDGTVNEAANALAGTEVALGILPGGATNVLCRHLGYPPSLPAATRELVRRAREGRTRALRLGTLNGRYFTVAGGAGLDAAMFARVERRPDLKARFGSAYLFAALMGTLWREFIAGAPVRFRVRVDGGDPFEAVFAIACHLDPATYLARWGVRLAPLARLDSSTDLTCFTGFPVGQLPALAWSVFVSGRHVGYPNVRYVRGFREAILEADRPFPIQVDGDVMGETARAVLRLEDTRLRVIG